MKRLIRALLFVSLPILFNTALSSADAQTLHALMVIMDYDHTKEAGDEGVGPACAVSHSYIENLLTSVEHICTVQRHTLLSSQGTANKAQIEAWLQTFHPQPDDMVFIYYAGHGVMNNWEEMKTLLATLDEYYLPRDDLVALINRYTAGARLRMLITDCCSSTYAPPPPEIQIQQATATLPPPVFEDLFLKHSGFLHITAATEGQYAWTRPPPNKGQPLEKYAYPATNPREGQWYGGWFTRSLINAINAPTDTNSDGVFSWEEVFQDTITRTEALFEMTTFSDEYVKDMERLRITNQTPKAYALPLSTNPNGLSPQTPLQLTGNITINGTDDEWGDDEYGELEHDIDQFIDSEAISVKLDIPDLRWGGECRVEVDINVLLINAGEITITGDAKLFEGISEDTNELEDDVDFQFLVTVKDKEPYTGKIELLNTETGGGDEATVHFNNFVIKELAVDATGYLNQGNERHAFGLYTAAMDSFDTALRINPYDAEAYYLRGRTKYHLKQDTDAIADFDKALQINPFHAFAYYWRGSVKEELEQYNAALADFGDAIRLKPDHAEAYYWRGIARYKLRQYNAAIQDFDEAIRLKSGDVYAYHWRGTAKYASEQYEAAIADHSTALRINPNRVYDYYWRGMAKYALERYSAAIADFDQAIRLDSKSAYAYHWRASTNEKLGRKSAATQDFRMSLRLAEETGNHKLKIGNEKWLEALSK